MPDSRAMDRIPRTLGSTFTYGQALGVGVSTHELYRLRDARLIESLGRGLHRRTHAQLADTGLV